MKHESSTISINKTTTVLSKDISEAHRVFYNSCVSLPKSVYSKDDCGKLKSKDSNHTRRSKQNTYHVVNKNIASSKFTDGLKTRGDAIWGIPKLRCLVVLEYYLGVPWASPSLGSCHSLFHSPSNLYPKLETPQHKTQQKTHEIR